MLSVVFIFSVLLTICAAQTQDPLVWASIEAQERNAEQEDDTSNDIAEGYIPFSAVHHRFFVIKAQNEEILEEKVIGKEIEKYGRSERSVQTENNNTITEEDEFQKTVSEEERDLDQENAILDSKLQDLEKDIKDLENKIRNLTRIKSEMATYERELQSRYGECIEIPETMKEVLEEQGLGDKYSMLCYRRTQVTTQN